MTSVLRVMQRGGNGSYGLYRASCSTRSGRKGFPWEVLCKPAGEGREGHKVGRTCTSEGGDRTEDQMQFLTNQRFPGWLQQGWDEAQTFGLALSGLQRGHVFPWHKVKINQS